MSGAAKFKNNVKVSERHGAGEWLIERILLVAEDGDGRLLGHDMARLRAAMLATQAHLANAPLPDPAETATSTGRAYASAIEDIVAS